MEKAMFNGLLLRTVIGYVGATNPSLSKKIATSLVASGLAAEADDRLSQLETSTLAEGLDVFQNKLLEDALSNGATSQQSMLYLELYCQQCSNLRMLRMYEGLLSRLIPQIENITQLMGCLDVLLTVCIRLRSLKWMPSVRYQFGSLSGRFLHKIDIAMSPGVDGSEWLSLMTAATVIVRTVHSLPASAMSITQSAIMKIQDPEAEDVIRLLASEYLASSTSDKKTTQSWIQLMGSLLQFLKECTDILFGSFEDSSFQWHDHVCEDDKGYALQSIHLRDAPLLGIVKVFSGGIDLLERLLTMPRGCHPIPIKNTLTVMIRILSVHDDMVMRDGMSPKAFELMGCLPGMQAMCWEMTRLLMCICGTAVLPYCRRLGDILDWSLRQTNQSSITKVDLHKTAVEYLQLTGAAGVLRLQESLMEAMKHEMPSSNKGGAFVKRPDTPKRSKKRKKVSLEETLEADVDMLLSKNTSTHVPSLWNPDTSVQSSIMTLIAAMLEHGGCILHNHILQSMDRMIAIHCYRCLQSNDEGTDGLLMSSMEAMLQSVLCIMQHRPSLLALAVEAFREGCGSQKPHIRRFCMTAMGQLDVFMHPRSMAWHPRASHQGEGSTSMAHVTYFPSVMQEWISGDASLSVMPPMDITEDHPSTEEPEEPEEDVPTDVHKQVGGDECQHQLPTLDIDDNATMHIDENVDDPEGVVDIGIMADATKEHQADPSSIIEPMPKRDTPITQSPEERTHPLVVDEALIVSSDSEGPLPELDSGASSSSADA